jgi:protein SCO1
MSQPETSRMKRPGLGKTLALVGALVAALLVVGAVIAAVADRDNSSGLRSSAGAYRGSEPPVRIDLPRFRLPTYRGPSVTSESLRGRVVVFTLLDSQCKDSCPIIASVVARTMDRLSADERSNVRAIAVSTDPAEDTPGSVHRFLSARRAEGRLNYLVGEVAQLRRLWRELHVLPSLETGNDSLHSAPVRVYDRRLVWVSTLHAGVDLTEENLLHDIRLALAAQGGNR